MSLTKHIEELCEAVSREQNPKKLLSLVDELNKELGRTAETPPRDTILSKQSIAQSEGSAPAKTVKRALEFL